MGCCFSQPDDPNSPYPGGAATSSARAINTQPQTTNANPTETNDAQQQQRQQSSFRRQRDRGPLDQHLNKPLKRHKWMSKDREWTRSELDKERQAFFDTRVTGRSEVWQSLHAACQQLWLPRNEGETDDNLATAQEIINTVEVTVPSGNLAKGAYDQLGNLYALPPYIVSDPANMRDDPGEEDDEEFTGDDEEAMKGELSGTTGEDTTDADADERRAEKGKGVVDAKDMITVRARVSENGRDYQTTVAKTDRVALVAQGIGQAYGIDKTKKKIRIAYMGRVLKDGASLEAQGWQEGHIVNAMVFDRL